MRHRSALALVLPVCLGAAFVAAFVAAGLGPGTRATPDGGYYVDAALRLADGRGYTTGRVGDGTRGASRPLTLFPPGLPAALALAMRASGARTAEAAAPVLVLAAALYAGAAAWLVLACGGPRAAPLAALAAGVCLTNEGGVGALRSLLSDLPFAAVATAALASALHLLRRGRGDPLAWAGVGALLGVSVLLRWAGLYWAGALLWGVLAARLATRRANPGAASGPGSRELGAALLALALVVGPWLLRNALIGDGPFGARPVAWGDPLGVAAEALRGVVQSLLPVGAWRRAPAPLLGAAALAVAAAGAARAALSRPRRLDPGIALLVATAAGYGALLVASTALHRVDSLAGARFWLVLAPVGLALVAAAVGGEGEGAVPRARRVVAAALGLGLVANVLGIAAARDAARDRGWLDPSYRDSGFVAALASLPACARVANEPRFVLLHDPGRAVYQLPLAPGAALQLPAGEPVCAIVLRRGLAKSKQRHQLHAERAAAELVRERGLVPLHDTSLGAVFAPPDGEGARR